MIIYTVLFIQTVLIGFLLWCCLSLVNDRDAYRAELKEIVREKRQPTFAMCSENDRPKNPEDDMVIFEWDTGYLWQFVRTKRQPTGYWLNLHDPNSDVPETQ